MHEFPRIFQVALQYFNTYFSFCIIYILSSLDYLYGNNNIFLSLFLLIYYSNKDDLYYSAFILSFSVHNKNNSMKISSLTQPNMLLFGDIWISVTLQISIVAIFLHITFIVLPLVVPSSQDSRTHCLIISVI